MLQLIHAPYPKVGKCISLPSASLLIFPIIIITYTLLVHYGVDSRISFELILLFHSGRQLLWHSENVTAVDAQNCTPPAIADFPSDLFTAEQRRAGAIAIHVVICCYLFVMLALICDDYFVPCIQQMCERKYNNNSSR
jgi:hypothetical protein